MKTLLQKLCMCLVILIASVTLCQAQIFIEQGKVELDLNPSEKVSGKINVHNTSEQEITVKVYLEDFVYQPPYDGTKEFLSAGLDPLSAKELININTYKLVLAPFAKRTLSYTVNAPVVFNQGRYGVLFFEKVGSKLQSDRGINVVTRVGTLFFVEPEGKKIDTELDGFQFSGNKLQAKWNNNGRTIVIPSAVYYVMDRDGVIFDRGKVEKSYLPPESQAPVHFELSTQIPDGEYLNIVTVDLGQENVLVYEVEFSKTSLDGFKVIEVKQ